ncbi:MAG: ABC transporter ATP-binding protein [Candidatus Nanopelagicales bacterium]
MTDIATVAPHPGAVPSASPDHSGPRGVISARGVTKIYESKGGPVTALTHTDLDIQPGRLTAIMGASGSGKSTLLHVLAGLDRVTTGRVWVDGVEISGLSEAKLCRLRFERIGFVFQSFNLMPSLSVKDNIELPAALWRVPLDRSWWDHVVDCVGIGHRMNHLPAQLSGGERQRVAIARALVTRPAVIVADEPTGNLDIENRDAILDLFRSLVDDGHSVLIVTHDPVVADASDEVIFIREGHVSEAVPTPPRVTIEAHVRGLR